MRWSYLRGLQSGSRENKREIGIIGYCFIGCEDTSWRPETEPTPFEVKQGWKPIISAFEALRGRNVSVNNLVSASRASGCVGWNHLSQVVVTHLYFSLFYKISVKHSARSFNLAPEGTESTNFTAYDSIVFIKAKQMLDNVNFTGRL